MIRNNLSWINLNAGSSGGGGGVSDYNDLANRPIISMTGTSQNPLKLWNLSTGLYLLNGYVYYNTTNTRECVNLFVSITAQIQNGKYVLSAFVPSWEGHYEYIKANSTSTDYTDTQILKMLTEDDVLTLTNEVEYTPTTDYHPSTKKYVDEAMQSVMEEFAKMGVNEQDIKTLIAENRRRDIAIQALLNETADKNVTIEEDTHTISLDYSMEDGMATVNSIEGSTLVNVSKTVDEVYVTKSQDRVEQSKVANTIGEQNGKLCPIIEGDTLVNVCDQKDPIAITKSYTIESSGNHITLQGEYDGKCRPVVQGNTMVNLLVGSVRGVPLKCNETLTFNSDSQTYPPGDTRYRLKQFNTNFNLNPNTTYTIVYTILTGKENNLKFLYDNKEIDLNSNSNSTVFTPSNSIDAVIIGLQTNTTNTVECQLTNIMLFEGDLTQTPELIPTEYVEGLKNSFEDNLVTQAMVDSGEESAENLGKYKVEYKVIGKNKLKEVIASQGIDVVTGNLYSNSEGSIWKTTNLIPIKPNTAYACSVTSMTNKNINYVYYDKDKKYLRYQGFFNSLSGTLTSPENAYYMRLRLPNEDLVTIQIEEGTVATEYEPYKEYTKTFYLSSPLLEGDTIEDINGVATHVKRYEKVVLNGSEKWYNYNITDGYFKCGCQSFRNTLKPGGGLAVGLPSDRLSYVGYNNNPDIIIGIPDSLVSSLGEAMQWLQVNLPTIIYPLASPIYEPISTESILCDSYVNGHLDVDSAVPIEKVKFKNTRLNNIKYLSPNTNYTIQFNSDSVGHLNTIYLNTNSPQMGVRKGINAINITTPNTIHEHVLVFNGIGFNASNIVVTEATDKDFDYFNGIQSTFEENLVTDENNPHYGKYRVIYRTKSSDGNASTVKSVYLNSPLLQGDKLVVVNGKLCHYHKMGKVVLDGSESWNTNANGAYWRSFGNGKANGVLLINTMNKKQLNWQGNFVVEPFNDLNTVDGFKQWLQANPTTVVYELETPYYEEISSNPKDTVVDFYADGTLEVQSAVYPLSMEFTSFEEELTYLYASTVYTVQFEANGNATVDITLGGTTVINQEITHGLNRIQVTTPSTLIDNKLIIGGCGDCRISNIVVTNSTEEFEYFEGMKSAFEDKQNEDGTYTVEIVVYNAPIRLNKDKE